MTMSALDKNFYQCPGCDCLACSPEELLQHFESGYAPDSCQAQHGIKKRQVLLDCAVPKTMPHTVPTSYKERYFAAECQIW